MSQSADPSNRDNASPPLASIPSAFESLPDILRDRITEAYAELRSTGFVQIWYRQAVYAALGSRHPNREAAVFGADRTPGHRRRTHLTLATLERILPVWHQSFVPRGVATLDLVPDILSIIRRLDAGDQAAIYDFGKPCHPFLSYCEICTPADYVMVAAGQAFHVAVYDADYQLDPLPPYRPDHQLQDIRRWPLDVPRLAADAEAKDPASLRAFWEWWLTRAIPTAWQAVV